MNYVLQIINMITSPDFKEKQILTIISDRGSENKIQFRNDNVLYTRNDKIINQLSCHKILSIFIVGDFSITTVLIKNCKKYGISLFLLKNNFELYASIVSATEGNYLLRMKQYFFKDEIGFSKNLVLNKVNNQLKLLDENKLLDNFDKEFMRISKKINNSVNIKELLGIEGSFTKEFFKKYFKEINWHRRLPRTKYDYLNVLMDIGYNFLFNYIDAILNLYGFDCYKGIYHQLFFQRKSLACDIMEPFRCIIDRQIKKSINLSQFKESDFGYKNQRYYLSFDKQQKYLSVFFEAILGKKEDIYNYIKTFYYSIIKESKNYPFFKII